MEKPAGWKKGGYDALRRRGRPFSSLRALLPNVSEADNAAAVLFHAVSYINDLRTKIQQLESQLPNEEEVTSKGVEVEVVVEVEIVGGDKAVVRVETQGVRYAEARVMEALRDLELKLHHATISNLNNVTCQRLVVGLPSPQQTTQKGELTKISNKN
ncbi:transcription factor MYC4-like [Momordica charantia]|uniref:Transcription factor n=1 Tax=Momordica charantia TaxID=3673 RepID=A0A6J1CRP5_MOMCH|nr:transcription factor MYC4-like [Momordica charantia]